MAESHVFAHHSDGDGLYHREVVLKDDGGLVIVGHDLGETEYEFERRISADGVRRLLASLGADGASGVLEVVGASFTSTHALEQRLEELGVETEFWSRVG